MARPTLPVAGETGWAAKMNTAVNDVSDRADQALNAVASGVVGLVAIDSFSGASDDAKFGAALSYASSQTTKPVLQFPARLFGPLTTTRAPYSGMRLFGPFGADGVKNLEIGGGILVNHKVRVQTGIGTSALFNQTADVNDVVMSQIAFDGSASSQFWNRAGGNVYPAQFDSLSFNGFQHVFGTPTAGFTMTQTVFSGHWTVLNYTNTPLTLKGSDNALWVGGFLNSDSPASVAGAGKPIVIFDFLQKTNVGYMYITAENDWIGLQVKGDPDRDIAIFGGTYEGRADTNPATRAVVDVQGGQVRMYGTRFSFVSGGGSPLGVCTQSGGYLKLDAPLYTRSSATAATFPLLYQTGGVAVVDQPLSGKAGEQIRVRWSDGTVATAAVPTNQLNA